MDQRNKEKLASWLKRHRGEKGYTQQELADMAGVSLRSIQRIENGEVFPRAYTLHVLVEKLGITDPTPLNTPETPVSGDPSGPENITATTYFNAVSAPVVLTEISTPDKPHITQKANAFASRAANLPRRLILTVSTGLLILLAIAAFIAQSPRFPETDFERFLLSICAIGFYTLILWRIWK